MLTAQTYTINDLGTLPGFGATYADDNNNTGLVTGCSDNSVPPTKPCSTNIPSNAFLWSKSDGMQDLNDMIPPNSGWVLQHASLIDKTGHIVGYGTINGANHAFLINACALSPRPQRTNSGTFHRHLQ